MHILCGLPRAGSTLLCNILAQNDMFLVTHTSIVAGMVTNLSKYFSVSIDLKSQLINDRCKTDVAMKRVLRDVCLSWHNSDKIIIDKSRSWNNIIPTFKHIFPRGKIIVLVRDLRDVFASIVKQHAKNPILDVSIGDSIYDRADTLFSPKGLIGRNISGIKDILDRDLDVLFLRYEELVAYPEQTIQRLYAYLGVAPSKHDYDDVVNTATEQDALYLFKYPHEGSGAVTPSKPMWQDYYSEDLAKLIMSKFVWYNNVFGYGSNKLRPMRVKLDVNTI